MVRGPETAPIWIFPEAIEFDQYGTVISKRDGYWVYTIAKSSSFVDLESQNGSVDLKSLSNIEIGENGQVIITHDPTVNLDKNALQDMRQMASGLKTPWVDGGKDVTKTTTVVIDDGRGSPRAAAVPSSPTAGTMVNPDGSVNQAVMQNYMRAAEDRIRQAQTTQTTPPALVPPQPQGK